MEGYSEQSIVHASNALTLEGVYKSYSGVQAVDGIDLIIRDGERVTLLGENGAGKSTTMRIISGLMKPDRGNVRIYGYKPSTMEAKRYIGYLPEDASPYLNLSVMENLEYIGVIRRTANLNERIEQLMDLLDMQSMKQQKPLSLSRGNRQKLCLALSIIHEPRFAIMDEPLNYLDIPTQERVFDYFNNMKSTFLISTHILSIAKRMTERIVVLSKGRKVWDGNLDELENYDNSKRPIEAIVADMMKNVR